MGTSGAYGGSEKSSWQDARRKLEALVAERGNGGGGASDAAGEPGQATSGDGGQTVGSEAGGAGDGGLAADVAAAIADALARDDPDLRPRRPPTYPLGSLLPSRTHGGTGGGGGTGGASGGSRSGSGGAPTAGRKQVARGVQRGAAAIAAAYAYREGNRAALRELNLDFDELAALGPRQRWERILSAVLGDSNHPDDQVLRRAFAEQMKPVLIGDAPPPTPLEAIQNAIASYVLQLGIVELRAQRRAGLDLSAVAAAEQQIRAWVGRRVRSVHAEVAGTMPIAQVQAAAAKILQEALRILRAGRTAAAR